MSVKSAYNKRGGFNKYIMTETNWKDVEYILDQVLDNPEKNRRRIAEALTNGDYELRRDVLNMLSAIEHSEDFMTQNAIRSGLSVIKAWYTDSLIKTVSD